MQPNADMVPKESGFNQSETTCVLRVRIKCLFLYSPATAVTLYKPVLSYKCSIFVITETQFATQIQAT